MRTFAIVNRKGGVGKTTTAVNLAYVLAASCHLRVLLVDADGQANATQILLPSGAYDGLGALLRGVVICYDELAVHSGTYAVYRRPPNGKEIEGCHD